MKCKIFRYLLLTIVVTVEKIMVLRRKTVCCADWSQWDVETTALLEIYEKQKLKINIYLSAPLPSDWLPWTARKTETYWARVMSQACHFCDRPVAKTHPHDAYQSLLHRQIHRGHEGRHGSHRRHSKRLARATTGCGRLFNASKKIAHKYYRPKNIIKKKKNLLSVNS